MAFYKIYIFSTRFVFAGMYPEPLSKPLFQLTEWAYLLWLSTNEVNFCCVGSGAGFTAIIFLKRAYMNNKFLLHQP